MIMMSAGWTDSSSECQAFGYAKENERTFADFCHILWNLTKSDLSLVITLMRLYSPRLHCISHIPTTVRFQQSLSTLRASAVIVGQPRPPWLSRLFDDQPWVTGHPLSLVHGRGTVCHYYGPLAVPAAASLGTFWRELKKFLHHSSSVFATVSLYSVHFKQVVKEF